MTPSGGANNYGTIFKINNDGTGYQLLYSFRNADDGAHPSGALMVSGSTLYGTTFGGGGATSAGTIFKINTDGTGFQVIHRFNGVPVDGSYPFVSLILSGATLYGTTSRGGFYDYGTVFCINTDGTGYKILHSFTGSSGDGNYPNYPLTLSGSTLYGMTNQGQIAIPGQWGTIFQIGTDGGGYKVLHNFQSGPFEGGSPSGSLTLSGSTLYGMTSQGGIANAGTIFRMNTDGTGYQLLYSFSGGSGYGESPAGSLTLSGATLYGMTQATGMGGTGNGTIFQVNTDGTGLKLLHSFSGSPADGGKPWGSLTLSGSSFYGMTPYGGLYNNGTIFTLPIGANN